MVVELQVTKSDISVFFFWYEWYQIGPNSNGCDSETSSDQIYTGSYVRPNRANQILVVTEGHN